MPVLCERGITIGYDTFGSRADPALVLFMGLGCQRVLWADGFCRELAERGLYVVRFDNRDLGESSHYDHLGRPALLPMALAAQFGRPLRPPYTLDDMAGDTLVLLDALGLPQAHLVGASMGGMITQHIWMRAPERVRSLCLWMTSMGDRPLPPPPPRVAFHLFRPRPRSRAEAIERGVRRLRSFGGGQLPFDEALARELVTAAHDRDPREESFLRHLAALVASPSRADALARARVPTLVLHGTHDPLVPLSHGEALARTIPGARLELLEGAGHEYPTVLWPRITSLLAEHAHHAEPRAAPRTSESV